MLYRVFYSRSLNSTIVLSYYEIEYNITHYRDVVEGLLLVVSHLLRPTSLWRNPLTSGRAYPNSKAFIVISVDGGVRE